MTLDEELAELGVGTTGLVVAERAPAPRPEVAIVETGATHPLAEQWAKWRPRFAEAMDLTFDTMDGLEKMVFQGRLQFWPGQEAAIITEIYTYAGGEKVIQAKWAAGDMTEITQMAAGIEAFGRSQGCTTSLIEGRGGWAKPLKVLGYQPWSVTLKKKL